MEARTLIRNVRSLNGLTRAELAKIANISPSTIGRIERGELDPSWSSMMSIVQSVGYSIGDRVRPNGDVSAVEAARRAIERDIGPGDSSSVASWLDRWLRAGLIDRRGVVPGKVGQIALLAGNAAAVGARPGVRNFGYTKSWQKTAHDLNSQGIRFATSGIDAALGGISDGGSDWPLMYVDDPSSAARAIGLSPAQEGQKRMTLLPFDSNSARGIRRDSSGFGWVDPVQGLVDAYAMPGRSADRADALVPRFERQLFRGEP
jgi:DNA-binding XRE family transcriptional regulator